VKIIVNITPVYFNRYREASPNFIDVIRKHLISGTNENILEKLSFTYKGVIYGTVLMEAPAFETYDNGRYTDRTLTYQLVAFDSSDKNLANVVDRFNIFFSIVEWRTGSYYADWHFNYENATMYIAKIVLIPEQIIPAHEDVRLVEIE